MEDFLTSAAFLPHGYCLSWRPGLLALHVISDLLIAASYFSIPIAIYVFLGQRRDFPFRWIAHLFAGFILLCGTTHLIAVVTLWWPVYGFEGWVKAATAVASVATAVLLWPLLPRALALPSPQVLWSTSQRLADEAAHRRAAEAALQRASGDLERAAERTADLYRSNDELEQFAYIASHDLQAPLRGIAHLVTWLEEDLGPALAGDTRHKMDLLRQRVRRLETMLSDLLQYSRAGRSVPSELIEPARLIADVIESIDPPAGFELEVDVPEGALRTAAAPLQQVVLNLIDNAVKHHDRTAGHIVVSARDRGERLEFAVTDDGPGIPAQQRERVFQMFYTLQPRDKVEGNGIGLAVVQKVVATRGGKVTIEDNPEGRGTTIRFDWPKTVEESGGE